ncbi:MAG: homoserine dehydrogenase [Nitrospirae bacterium]|nr:homoserine dehydrogenase [Nitrospirota bacterium]
MKKIVKIGLIGWGTVGGGLVKILKTNAHLIEERLGGKLEIKAIADKDIVSPRSIEIDKKLLTTDVESLLHDPEIDIIVELIGGKEPARTYLLEAIKEGKHIVTANKALLAECGEIFKAAGKRGVNIGFEGSVGGGMPIIKVLKEGLVANRMEAILGIINGTANYILSRMTSEDKDFQEVLAEAKRLGYAESDPAMDVEGTDSAHKLAILASLAFGTRVKLNDIYVEGIKEITQADIRYAKEVGYSIKLLSIAKENQGRIEARVHPTLLPQEHLLASVNGVFNACFLTGDAVGNILVYGQGAGEMAAGSAVAADLVDLARNILSGTPHRVPVLTYPLGAAKMKPMKETLCRYYLRFSVLDRPGVLGSISNLLGKKDIGIASVIQKERREEDIVPIVIMTHEAKEENIRIALQKIDQLAVVKAKTMLIRVED